MVTVTAAYELQYADGMSFYQYVKSNPNIFTDPSGLVSVNSAFGIHNWYTELGAAKRAIGTARKS